MTFKLRSLILEAGAWDDDTKTSSEARKLQNLASRENYKQNPFQYFFNPFIRGPLAHLSSETYDGIVNILYKIIKNKDSKDIKSFAELKKELKKIEKKKDIEFNPWEKDIITLIKGIEDINNTIENIKDKHFFQWLVNPFVKGKITTNFNNKHREQLEKAVLEYSKASKISSQEKYDKIRQIKHLDTMDKIPQLLDKENKDKGK